MPAQRKAYPRSIVVVEGRKLQGLHDRAVQLLHRGNLHAFPSRFWLAVAILLAAPTLVLAQQTSNVAPRITAAVDTSSRVTIPQSKHPLAQPAFDAGPLDGTTPMQRMILVLGVSPEQAHDLTTFLDSQQTQGSPDYHNWLTPDQFGQRFGPAPQDIQVVISWLQQQGFTVGSVARSGRWIEFSGTSAQVEAALQTQMRRYLVNGEAHVANASNISIPAALSPVVRGVASLHNFFSKPMHVQGAFVRRTTNGTYAPLGGETDLTIGHALSPADFATIYDVPNSLLSPAPSTVLNGTGEAIAIVARTDINSQDVADFRTVTGLPAATASNPNFILNGEDPGIWSLDDQVETTLDTEWSGAVAPAATIDVVISQPTLIEDGVDLSSIYIVDHNLAPIMSVSFAGCEALNGSGAGSESSFFNSLWQQAAAQGISVFVASGDDGAADCDPNAPVLPPGASGGVGISALSSPWYDTAVGGTEFNESITTTNFWNPVNATNLGSVLGYIPEMVWNDSCSTGCDEGFDSLEAGGGGVSVLYATPPYQTLNVSGLHATLSPFAVSGVTPRAVPDVSLAASPNHDGYLLCLNFSCEPSTNPGFYLVGGTSASSPAFAGIMALVDQKLGNKPQGLANYVLYPLAAAETYGACNSSSRTNPATPTTCIFNDNTVGNNGVPGNDVTNDPTSGALGYPAGTGFDLASGLGSVDANNLINAWSTSAAAFFGTQTTITSPASINITHGTTVAITGSTSRLSTDGTTLTPTGTIALIAQGGPFPNPVGLGSTTLSGSGATATGTVDIGDLPGGSYTLYANYPGNGTFAGSASTAINVTVAKEAPAVELADAPAGASALGNTPITVSYGTPIAFETLISGLSRFNDSTGDGAATGTVTFTRTLGSTTSNLSPAITLTDLAQADAGNAEFFDCSGTPSTCLTPGANTINGSYSGDNSYTAGNSGTSNPSFSLLVTITSATTSTSVSSPASGTTVLTTTPVTLNAAVATSSGSGNAPNGTVTFFSGSTQLRSPVAATGTAGNQTFAGAGTPASAVASLTTTLPAGTDNITAIYNGDTADSNYAASSASAPIVITVTAMAATTTTVSASPNPSTVGQTVTITATVTSTQTSPAITGTVTFSEGSTTIGSAPVSSGQAILMTAALPLGTFTIKATYSGDTNYTGSSGTTTTAFTVNNPAPTLTSISPTSGIVGQAVSSLVLTGSGFVASSTVNFGSNQITGGTVGSGGTTLTVTVPAGDVATAGPVSVTVTNGTPGGGTSGPETFTVDNPVPTITQLSPASATAGGGAFALTITGTNFGAGATVTFGTFTGLVPTSITATTIVVTVPATDIATGGTINVSVSNPAPGGGTSGTLPFTINNPLPTVTSLSPTSATAGGGAFTLTITGTNFVAGATVTFGSFGPLTPTSVTATQIAVTIPTADIATAASINVSVSNPAPGGGTSATSANSAFAIKNPAPILTSISPTSGIVGQAVSSLVLSGSGFVASSTVNFGSNQITGGTVGSGGSTLTVTVPAGDVATAGPVSVTVTNGTPGGGTSGPETFTVDNPVPTITQLSPASATAGGGAFALTITGTNFGTGATVTFGSFGPLTPTSVTAPQIAVTVPAADTATAASINVSVSDPAPGGGTSATSANSAFAIKNPTPTLTSISPTSGPLGQAVSSLVFSGSGFVAGSTVNFGSNQITGGTVGSGGSTLTVTVPAGDVATAGPVSVTVTNGTPGGGTSGPETFTVDNPVPTITQLSPASANAGGAAFGLTITGTGFAAGATVTFGTFGSIVPTTISPTQIVVQIPATDIATAGNVNVAVTNVTPGGGTSTAKVFPINNAVPTITGLSPTGVTVNSGAFNLTITGTGFAPGATVSFGTFAGLVPTSITGGKIVVQIPAGDIGTVSSVNVAVTNPTPGGGPSTGFSFSIASTPNPAPTLTSISPTSGTTGQSVNLTLTGTNFIAGSIVTFGGVQDSGATPGTGGNTLTITIPASQLSTAGPVSVTVTNPAPGGGTSLAQTFTINNPPPVVTAVSPTSGIVGQAVSSLVLTGSGFVASSTVNFGSNQITGGTPGSGGTTLTVTVPAGDVATAGPVSVTVTNATPGGGTSGPQTFTVDNPVPTITQLSPASATAGGGAFALTITGTNFGAGATVTFGTFTGLVPTSITATTIVVAVPATDIATGGTINVSVSNPAPGGGTSGTLPFTINNPLPTVTSLSPTSATAGGGAFTLTITGTNFVAGATVTFGSFGPLTPTSVTATQIAVTIPAADIATAASINVSVSNPAPGGGTSATSANSAFAIKNPTPILTSISPTSGTLGQAVSSLVFSGSGFVAGSTVNFGSNQITGGTVGSGGSTLTVTVPAGDVATAGPVSVTVTNGTPGGGTSGPETFTVDNPVPTITQLSPASANAGGAAFGLTITGTGFAAGATVTFGTFGSIVPTTISPTQIVVQIPATDIATSATINVSVSNPAPGGGTSGTLPFTINNPLPTITSLSPTSATAGGGAFTLTITGTNFVAGATVTFGSFGPLTPTSVTATQIAVTIPAADIATAASINVSVSNPAPGGGTSATSANSAFAIKNPTPTLTSIAPTSGIVGQAVSSLVLSGSGFVAGSTVNFGSNQITGGTVGSGGSTLTVTVPAGDVATAGAVNVTVTNAAPGGGTSGPETFTVDNPVPTITQLSPASASAGGGAFALTITGTNFGTGATVTFGSFGPLTPTSVTATQIAVTIPAADIATAASINVSVTNPAPGGGASNAEPFTIEDPVPSLASLSPTSTTAGGVPFALTINGSGFRAGATVNFGSNDGLVPTSITAGQIVVQIPAAATAASATVNVTVTNPSPTTGPSNPEIFTVNNPVPTISSVSPTHAPGGAGFTMTITGTGFVTGATVTVGTSQALTPTTVSPTQVVVAVPASDMAASGTPKVSVTNPTPGGGASTEQVTFTVDDFTVAIAASPTSVTAGQSLAINVTLGPTDSNGFGNAVSFSVSGLPGNSTVSPNPIPAVTVGNSFATFVLTLSTTMRSAVPATPRRPVQPLGIQIILWSMTVALALMALATPERGHRTRRWRVALPSAVLLAVLAVASGCTTTNTNSGTAGTPAGPYQISVTATSGTLVHTSPAVTITVN